MDDDVSKDEDEPPRGLHGGYSYHAAPPERMPTGRHRPIPPDPEPAHDVPTAPKPQPRTTESVGGKFADRIGQSVLVICLTYLAANGKLPAEHVEYVGGALIGGLEALRLLTRIRLVGVSAAGGALGVVLVILAGGPGAVGASALAIAATLLGWQRQS